MIIGLTSLTFSLLDPERLLPFLLVVGLIELTPGPNMAYLSLVSAREGRTAGFLTVIGITAGLAVYMLASVAGLAEIAIALPWAYDVLRWAGVVYLVWLAWDTWQDRNKPTLSAEGDDQVSGRLMLRGFITNILNPKAAIFYISLVPTFTRPQEGHVALQSLILGITHLVVALIIHCVLVSAAGTVHPFIADNARSKRLHGAFALGLLAVAAWVAWTTRST